MKKAQIISTEKIDKLKDGKMCYLLRTVIAERKNEQGISIFNTRTDRVLKEQIEVPLFNADGTEILINEDGTPQTTMKEAIVVKQQKDTVTTLQMTANEVDELTLMIKPLIPVGITATEERVILVANALLHNTKNDKDLPNGYMGTKKWEIL